MEKESPYSNPLFYGSLEKNIPIVWPTCTVSEENVWKAGWCVQWNCVNQPLVI